MVNTSNRGVKENRAAHKWIFHLYSIAIASAFVRQSPLTTTQQHRHPHRLHQDPIVTTTMTTTSTSPSKITRNFFTATKSSIKDTADESVDVVFDALLEEPSDFAKAIRFFQSHPDEIDLPRDRFERIFDAIEERTSTAEENGEATGTDQQQQGQPMISQSRKEMTEMYSLLKDQGHLRLFGSITKENMPASGSHTVRPSMLEAITSLSMNSLTPRPSNTLLYAGIGVAVIESIASEYLGWDLNILFFATFTAALCDQLFLNGALSETSIKILSPGTQPKITRHEAGHFLCSYILGCPVEGYVLSAWGALQDPRFKGRGVSAGTSFFDSNLSSQMENSKITRSSIDRYSIIVMAGIAAEAISYGRADGGAGDEQALIAFLSNLNGDSSSSAPAWNDLTIRNQARWGALQSVLILKEYKECYDALVDALERGGSLGDCIYAIENAGREYNKEPLRIPLGYISEEGENEIWTKVIPNSKPTSTTSDVLVAAAGKELSESTIISKQETLNADESLQTLRAYKETITSKLKDIEEKLEGL